MNKSRGAGHAMMSECCSFIREQRFAGKTVLVTGGASGIGFAIAHHFLAAGATVVVNDVSPERLRGATERLRPYGERATALVADVSAPEQVETMMRDVLEHHGTIDILVSNAGIYPSTPFIDIPIDEWDAVMQVNVRGAFLVGQVVARSWVDGGRTGHIVNVTSTSYERAREGFAHYCSSKAALVMLTRVMAMELARHGIRVNSVAPGLIDVEAAATPVTPEYQEATIRQIPVGRLGSVEDVAHAVLFLATPEAGYVTGAILVADGGLSLGRYGIPL